ncbi:MAG TPA: PilZ domain-containing protein [Solirubrobacteraceae bacterium]|nr:PilZ domain-containing protein [Solirubrobacteraceae bacterium]
MEREVSAPSANAHAMPGVGTALALRLVGCPELSGRVRASAGGALDLSTDPGQTQPPPGAQGFVEFVGEEGVCQLPGRVSAVSIGGLVFEHAGVVELLRRRAFVRAAMELEVSLTRLERGSLAVAARTVDVSGGGLLLARPGPLEVGELLEFELRLDSGPPLRGRCRPVRRTADGHMGVQITELEPADRDRLVHRVFARQVQLSRR